MMGTYITSFRGTYAFLSNMYKYPQTFRTNTGSPMTFPCSEAAFQARKSMDPSTIETFTQLNGPKAKAYGRNIPLVKQWDTSRIGYMKLVLEDKFSDPVLRKKLIDTGDALLVEENTWHDDFWGVCTKRGQNHLGILLMELREQYRREDAL